ncbi:unnamed protein product [Tetraodon nigroviridis]|uniref:(spotted green pufferfish) hypothetical protein n=1 Tax=Tetraodon nigroviridis TaxID=99883 RepID=Q4RB70_TETNG|nr:unnamed protein product [Tetraodon nigroviridis]
MGGASDGDGGGESRLLEAPVKISGPPERAAELNYQENTVAKGSRKGYSIDLSHSDSGKSVGGSEGRAANESDGEKKRDEVEKGAS